MGSDIEGESRKDARERQQTNADLDRVTDYVGEERELDAEKFRQSMNVILDTKTKDKTKEAREKELAVVVVKEEDIALVASEMEIETKVAERVLREHQGDVVAALRSLIHA
eukprot:CAMPEP_0182444466 /NCGR_PEP_ID=MMETSP1172-20130603/2910_1 /TAXON_ID=708627 /ORGANISM="Timspurckia oligopyrenoides, Strain CCMP3278" /LENGTH=110 /DNA_ID=CAMNT_0024640025 /DNA_START=31 /DNA_END=363 /DNA_ORIENTATION=+